MMDEKVRSMVDAMADTIDDYRKTFEDVHRIAMSVIGKMPQGECGLSTKVYLQEIVRMCEEVLGVKGK